MTGMETRLSLPPILLLRRIQLTTSICLWLFRRASSYLSFPPIFFLLYCIHWMSLCYTSPSFLPCLLLSASILSDYPYIGYVQEERSLSPIYPSLFLSFSFLFPLIYSLILDCCITDNVGVFAYINIFVFTGFFLLISYIIISKKTMKHCFQDNKRVLLLKDSFLILQIAGIMNGIFLPLASTLFVVLDHFHLISA